MLKHLAIFALVASTATVTSLVIDSDVTASRPLAAKSMDRLPSVEPVMARTGEPRARVSQSSDPDRRLTVLVRTGR